MQGHEQQTQQGPIYNTYQQLEEQETNTPSMEALSQALLDSPGQSINNSVL